jgi:hypothetical protein
MESGDAQRTVGEQVEEEVTTTTQGNPAASDERMVQVYHDLAKRLASRVEAVTAATHAGSRPKQYW